MSKLDKKFIDDLQKRNIEQKDQNNFLQLKTSSLNDQLKDANQNLSKKQKEIDEFKKQVKEFEIFKV